VVGKGKKRREIPYNFPKGARRELLKGGRGLLGVTEKDGLRRDLRGGRNLGATSTVERGLDAVVGGGGGVAILDNTIVKKRIAVFPCGGGRGTQGPARCSQGKKCTGNPQ